MRVHHVRHEGSGAAQPKGRRHLRQRRKALRVIGEVGAVRFAIGRARPVVQMRRVEAEQAQPGRRAVQHAGRPAEQVGHAVHRRRAVQGGQHGGVTWHQGPHLDPLCRERRRQRARHVPEAAGLDKWNDLGRDRQDAERRHACSLLASCSLSIMGCVIRHTPRLVRRKRAASCSASSPTTRPSGMRTPRSMTTLRSRADRPTRT